MLYYKWYSKLKVIPKWLGKYNMSFEITMVTRQKKVYNLITINDVGISSLKFNSFAYVDPNMVYNISVIDL